MQNIRENFHHFNILETNFLHQDIFPLCRIPGALLIQYPPPCAVPLFLIVRFFQSVVRELRYCSPRASMSIYRAALIHNIIDYNNIKVLKTLLRVCVCVHTGMWSHINRNLWLVKQKNHPTSLLYIYTLYYRNLLLLLFDL